MRPSPRTGRQTGSASSRKRAPAKRGRRLFQHDRRFERRFVAGADEAGRGCLAGPLVAAAVLFDLERLRPSDVRALSTLNDSKQHTAEAREELYPRVLRVATPRARRVALRAAGSTAAACIARTWRHCATRCAASRSRAACA